MMPSLRRALGQPTHVLAGLALLVASTGVATAQSDEKSTRDSDWQAADTNDFEDGLLKEQLERAAENGDWEEYGRLWGEWGEQFGERMGQWGERFGENFAEAFSERDWEEFGAKWEQWGEDLSRKMEAVDWEAYGKDWEQFGEEMSRAFENFSDDESFEEIGARVDAAVENVDWSHIGDLLDETFAAIDFDSLGDLIADAVEISVDASSEALDESLDALEELDPDHDRKDGRLNERE